MELHFHEEKLQKLLRRNIIPKLEQSAQETTDHIKQKLSGGRRGSIGSGAAGAGLPPHVDTGALRQSMFWELIDNGGKISDVHAIVGTTKTYGLYLELGAFIRPKSAKMLAIPWSPEARRHAQGGGRARSFIESRKCVMIKTPRGAVLVVEKMMKGRGKGRHEDRGVIHYILTTHARIPPHPFLRPGLHEMGRRIREIFAA